MIEIDGRKGGGQMLRTSLGLSAASGNSFVIENIRGSRSNPGIKNQHLECIKAAEKLSNAKTSGAELNSERLVFEPKELENTDLEADISTAGSISLLFDTVLPITTQFNSGFSFEAVGGTDVKWSPTLDYLEHVKLPILRKFGFKGKIEREKTGYYPEGGGKAILGTEAFSMDSIVLEMRGGLEAFEIYSRASSDLESGDVADRQAKEAERKLKNSFDVPIEKNIFYEDTASTGSSIMLKAVYENSIAGFDALGERGKSSEDVAGDAIEQFRSFHASEAAVDSHMADQLMSIMAVVGGRITAPSLTNHMQTSIAVLERFGLEPEYFEEEVLFVEV